MKANPIIFLVALVIIAVGAYWFYSSNNTSSQGPLSVSSATAQNSAQTRFETLLSQLKPITFDTSIFSNPDFQILVDIATPVQPEASGRTDPFAPFSGSATTGGTTGAVTASSHP